MPSTMRLDPGIEPTPSADDAPKRVSDETVTKIAPQRRVPAASPSARARGATKAPRAKRCPACEQMFSGEARFCPFDGDTLIETADYNPSADPLIGQTIDGRYEVVDVIGEGGMGTVYEVRHVTLGRRFALKVLRRDIADAEHTARFLQEAKAAAAIGHPNIVAVSDFGEVRLGGPDSAAVPYFVMEFLTGISLAALLRSEKTLSPQRAAGILLQCASGLAAAHAAGVIHRDLKPDNVFLTPTAEKEFVKLLDFGVAKMVGQGRLTRAGMVFGTPHYMSPEQAAGQSVDHRADVYALGVILYECFAGHVPFEADTYMGVLTKHMFATPEPLSQVAPDASSLGALGPIAMRCLAKSPADRYASMVEVAAAIEHAMGEVGARGSGRAPAMAAASSGGSMRPRETESFGESDPALTPVKPLIGPRGIAIGALTAVLVAIVGWVGLRAPTTTTPTDATPTAAVSSTVPVGATTATASAAPIRSPPAVPTAAITAQPAASTPPPALPTATPSAVVKKADPPPRVPVTPPRHPKTSSGGEVVDPWGH
ncbi:MAG: serine/threonine-protein kinase [Byssovorax sp.]